MRAFRSVVVGCVLSAHASTAFGQGLVVPGPAGTPIAPAPPPPAPAAPPAAPAPAAPPAATVPAPPPWQVAPPAAGLPPDIVRLKNGGFVRGVIIELDPTVRTVIQLDTGRREIPASEIVYAGPAARDPLGQPPVTAPAPTPPPAVPLNLVPDLPLIELRSETPSVTFFLWTGAGTSVSHGRDDWNASPLTGWTVTGSSLSFRPLCTAPCVVPLREGAHRMGVARAGERPVLLEGDVQVRRGVPLQAEYTVDKRSRVGPAAVMAGSAAMLVVGAIVGLRELSGDEESNLVLPAVLLTAGSAGLITGAILLRRDADTVRIRPILPGAATARQAMAPRVVEGPRPLGPTFTGTF